MLPIFQFLIGSGGLLLISGFYQVMVERFRTGKFQNNMWFRTGVAILTIAAVPIVLFFVFQAILFFTAMHMLLGW